VQTERIFTQYMLDLATRGNTSIIGPDQSHWRDLLVQELGNIRAAHAWLIAHTCVEPALRLIIALKEFWWIVGNATEMREALENGIASVNLGEVAPHVRAGALTMAAELAAAAGELDQALVFAERARATALAAHDAVGIANATEKLGIISIYLGDNLEARKYLSDAVARYRELGDDHRLGRSLCHLASLGELGSVDRPGNPADIDRARTQLNEALALFRDGGYVMAIGKALVGLGTIAYRQGEYAQAEAFLREAIAGRWALHDLWEIGEPLDDLADVAGVSGRWSLAARLYGAVDGLREMLGQKIAPVYQAEYERELAVSRTALGDDRFFAEWSAGRARPLEETIAEALAGFTAATTSGTAGAAPTAATITLTPRDLDVMRLVTEGKSNQTIADDLFISLRTVKGHLVNVFAKLGVDSRTAAAMYAQEHDLLTDASPNPSPQS
jgi:DNA-binding CsgD family transcriptional regulator/tetratricopeptide (TPR) repeat protein